VAGGSPFNRNAVRAHSRTSAAPVRPYSALRFVQRDLPGAYSIPPTLADLQSQGVAGSWHGV
jgi:hypothetical protein